MENDKIEITKEEIQSWNVFFAIPCYNSVVTEPFFTSFLKTSIYLNSIGLNWTLCTIADSLINRARNNLIAKFLGNKECTHIMFIDSDIQFDHESILKLLWQDKDVITGSYPIKEIDWKKVKELSVEDVAHEDLLAKSTKHVVHLAKENQTTVNVEKGAIEVFEAGTGFMLIKREALEKMMEQYQEYKYVDDTGALSPEEADYAYAFFNSYVDETGRFLSEDYGFCRYWQNIGGKIWLDPSINLSHFGSMKFTSSIQDYINSTLQFNP